MEGTGVVTELQAMDVLLGRGSGPNDHEGNIRFRQLVAERKDEYLATNHRQTKAKIAQEIVDAVYGVNGRFLKKIELADARDLGLPKNAEAWVMVDEDTVMEKAKQALRQNTAKTQERRSVSPKRGASPNARGQTSPKRNQSPTRPRSRSPQPQRSPLQQQQQRHPMAMGSGSGHQIRLDDFDPLPLQQQLQQQYGGQMTQIPTMLQQQTPNMMQAQMEAAGWAQQMQQNAANLGGVFDSGPILPAGNMAAAVTSNSQIQDWGQTTAFPQQQPFGDMNSMAPPQPRIPSVTSATQQQVVDSLQAWSQHSQQQQQLQAQSHHSHHSQQQLQQQSHHSQRQQQQDGHDSGSEYEEDLDVPLVVGGNATEDGLTPEERRKRRQSLQMEDLMDSFSQLQAAQEGEDAGKLMGESTDTMGTIDQIGFDNSTTMMSVTSIGSNFSMFTSPMGESVDSMFPSRGVSRNNSKDDSDLGFKRQGTGSSTASAPFRRKGTDSSMSTAGEIPRFRRQGTPSGGAAYRQSRGTRGGPRSSTGSGGAKSGNDDPPLSRQMTPTDISMNSFASMGSSLGDVFGAKRSSLLERLVNEEKQRADGQGNTSAASPAPAAGVAAELAAEPRPVGLIEEDPDQLTSLGKSSMSVMNAAFGSSMDGKSLSGNNPNGGGSNAS